MHLILTTKYDFVSRFFFQKAQQHQEFFLAFSLTMFACLIVCLFVAVVVLFLFFAHKYTRNVCAV